MGHIFRDGGGVNQKLINIRMYKFPKVFKVQVSAYQ